MTNAQFKQNWRTIAEAFYTSYYLRNKQQRLITACGLCFAFQQLAKLNGQSRKNLCYDLNTAARTDGFYFGIISSCYDFNNQDNNILKRNNGWRGDQATLFSLMTIKQFKRLIKG